MPQTEPRCRLRPNLNPAQRRALWVIRSHQPMSEAAAVEAGIATATLEKLYDVERLARDPRGRYVVRVSRSERQGTTR